MNLASPLRTLIPSLESAVLEVLVRTESQMSPTQIARLAPRGSRQGLTLALDRLVEHGLVVAEPANHGYGYRFNRGHVLAETVFGGIRAKTELVERLESAIATLDPQPMHVALFGSVARGDGDEGSDIDLFVLISSSVDVRDDEDWKRQLRRLEDDVLVWTGNRLEPLVLTFDDLVQAVGDEEPIVDSLLADAIGLHGPPLRELVEIAREDVRRRRRR